jgi:hypothetical protein
MASIVATQLSVGCVPALVPRSIARRVAERASAHRFILFFEVHGCCRCRSHRRTRGRRGSIVDPASTDVAFADRFPRRAIPRARSPRVFLVDPPAIDRDVRLADRSVRSR